MDLLTEPFEPAYMQRALLEVALLSVPAGALGVYVILRRLAFATHALGVGAFPGVVLAVSIGASAFVGGLVAALVMAFLLTVFQRRQDLDAPAAVGLLLAGALALGSVLVSDVFEASAGVDTLLFGSLLGVTDGDLVRSAVVALVVIAAVVILGRPWLLVAFDRENAPALGFRPGQLDLGLFVVIALAVVASIDAVGVLLVSALFVVPAATMRLFVTGQKRLVVSSAGLALVLAVAGLIVSFHTNAPPGATIAAVAAGLFVVAVAVRSLVERTGRQTILAAAGATLALVAAGCGGGDSGPESSLRLTVVASTPIVADWAESVGGDEVDVVRLLGPNVDPHDYEPTPADAEKIASADVVLSSGAGFDEFMDDLVVNAGSGVTFVELAPGDEFEPPALEESHEEGHSADEGGDEHGDVDPHFWHDPTLAALAVETIEQTLAEVAPDEAETFAANTEEYLAELESLDAELSEEFGSVPAEYRQMVTDHDAFGYLARRHAIEVLGAAIPSTSTAAEPNAKETAELIETIRAKGVCSVFSESSVDPKLIEQIAGETGANVVPDLYGDTLGPEGSGAETYLSMMRHNAGALVEGFAC